MLRYDALLIRVQRQRAGLTQQAAADLAGMHIRQWQKYEANEAEPLISQYLKMIEVLDLDADGLLRHDARV